MNLSSTLEAYPVLAGIADAVVAVWPEHGAFLAQRFADATDPALPIAEEMARLVQKIAGEDLPRFVSSYRWMCEAFVAEDLHFRRKGTYRLSSFEEVSRLVYSQPDYMDNYLRGILLSQILWANQATAFHFYVERFLGQVKQGADYLEIGPGHGLLIYFAARSPRIGSIAGWDVSDSSLAMTRRTLETMGVARPFVLQRRNILELVSNSEVPGFDAIVISEVMEHLDRPEAALATVRHTLRPGGLLFLNVPVNSPAPDHIYHWPSPDAVADLVRDCGFVIVEERAVPSTGYDLARALRRRVTVNALIVASLR